MMLAILFILVLVVAYGALQVKMLVDKFGSTEGQIRMLVEGLNSIGQLLSAEFNKEKVFYEEMENVRSRVQEYKEVTHGLGDPSTLPASPAVPGIILVGEMLRSTNEKLAYLRPIAEVLYKLACEQKACSLPTDSK